MNEQPINDKAAARADGTGNSSPKKPTAARAKPTAGTGAKPAAGTGTGTGTPAAAPGLAGNDIQPSGRSGGRSGEKAQKPVGASPDIIVEQAAPKPKPKRQPRSKSTKSAATSKTQTAAEKKQAEEEATQVAYMFCTVLVAVASYRYPDASMMDHERDLIVEPLGRIVARYSSVVGGVSAFSDPFAVAFGLSMWFSRVRKLARKQEEQEQKNDATNSNSNGRQQQPTPSRNGSNGANEGTGIITIGR